MKECKGDQAIGITCGFGIGLLIGAAFGSLAYCLSVGALLGSMVDLILTFGFYQLEDYIITVYYLVF
ncbi:hypothetical protein DX928_13915 [Bacillus swezeyi]|uniref:Uncharacterized protein n=1 Tax=Bacillus swezeyi TaxID=1925020 RepID=A0A5M8RRK7_9BACI|nr:hypothetical protein DX927_07535 [Bacillus swezeyi]KAA6475099.1 hypothetical protein DX928_13915 [Bacillus swezeyi]